MDPALVGGATATTYTSPSTGSGSATVLVSGIRQPGAPRAVMVSTARKIAPVSTDHGQPLVQLRGIQPPCSGCQ